MTHHHKTTHRQIQAIVVDLRREVVKATVLPNQHPEEENVTAESDWSKSQTSILTSAPEDAPT